MPRTKVASQVRSLVAKKVATKLACVYLTKVASQVPQEAPLLRGIMQHLSKGASIKQAVDKVCHKAPPKQRQILTQKVAAAVQEFTRHKVAEFSPIDNIKVQEPTTFQGSVDTGMSQLGKMAADMGRRAR